MLYMSHQPKRSFESFVNIKKSIDRFAYAQRYTICKWQALHNFQMWKRENL